MTTAVEEDRYVLLFLTIGALIFYAAPWAPVYLLALGGVTILSFLRPDLSLVLVPLFAPFFMQPKHLLGKQFAPSEIFLLVTLAAVLILLVRRNIGVNLATVVRFPLTPPALLLLFAGMVSAAFAADRHQALQELRLVIIEPVLFLFLLHLLARRHSLWRYLIGALILGALAACGLAVLQYLLHRDLTTVPGSDLVRVHGPYGSPDNLGLLLDRVVPIWLALTWMSGLRSRWRAMWWIVGAVLLVTLVITVSKAAWAASAGGCLAVATGAFRWGKYVALAAVLLGGLLIIGKGSALEHAFRSQQTNTVQKRVDVWKSSLEMVRRHPLVGIGPDNFIHYYAPRQGKYLPCPYGLGYVRPQALDEPCLSHPHDEFLDFWLSTGIVGLGAFLWTLVVFWSNALWLWRRVTDPEHGALLLGVMAAMLAGLLHGLVDNGYFLVDLAVMFWLFCGYISFLRQEYLNESCSLPPAGVVP